MNHRIKTVELGWDEPVLDSTLTYILPHNPVSPNSTYEYMRAEDPCLACGRSPYCAESGAVCLAFAEYVDTGKFNEDSRGKASLPGAFEDFCKQERSTRRKGKWDPKFLKS